MLVVIVLTNMDILVVRRRIHIAIRVSSRNIIGHITWLIVHQKLNSFVEFAPCELLAHHQILALSLQLLLLDLK